VSIVLAVALLFAVWTTPTFDLRVNQATSVRWWMLCAPFAAWAVAIGSLALAIAVLEKGWP
jgi:cytochrome bd-type quinol oxidase subunit 2